ncbi:MAG: hypothetical protein O3A95_04240 [Planctomycetota bacterium]|nr:hypothetical protein [Planctomycetota bacterium]MDA1113493.1 hypothetical protein [Planctomycetota bacterium]
MSKENTSHAESAPFNMPTTMVVDAFPVRDPARREAKDLAPRERSIGSHLAGGVWAALARPRLLLFLMGVSLVLPLVVALPAFFAADQHLSNFEAIPGGTPIDLPTVAPAWIFEEWFRAAPTERNLIAQSLAPLLILASLFNLVITAGWMRNALLKRRRHSLRTFLQCGGHFFFPFLRTWILALPMFACITWIFWGTPAEWLFERMLPEGDASQAASEQTGRWLETLRQVLFLIALWKTEILLDLARASMICGNRRSALVAIGRGIGFFLRSPWQVFGLMSLGFALELFWIAGAKAVQELAGWPMWTLLLILPFGRIVFRGARYVSLASFYAAKTHDSSAAEESREAQDEGDFPDMAF